MISAATRRFAIPGTAVCQVVIIDDHEIVSEALAALLNLSGIEVVGKATNAEEGLQTIARLMPDVVLMDINLPGINGIQAAHRIMRDGPQVKVLMLSAWDDESYVLESLLSAKAVGYVLKSDDAASLVAAIKAVQAGKRYISPSVAGPILERLRSMASSGLTSREPLSRRERELVKLIAEGGSAKEIASKLRISPKTVQAHKVNLSKKLGLRSTSAITIYAIKTKLIAI